MQRLFSTFPEGWPGIGLIILRVVTVMPIIHHGLSGIVPRWTALIDLQLVAMCAATLLLVGLWTPVAGVVIAASELCLAFLYSADPWAHILPASMAVALAMLGPGAWSLDARLFGRKRIQVRVKSVSRDRHPIG